MLIQTVQHCDVNFAGIKLRAEVANVTELKDKFGTLQRNDTPRVDVNLSIDLLHMA